MEKAEFKGEGAPVLKASRWRDYFLPLAAASLFAAFALKLHFGPSLWVTSLFVLILLQVMVVDFEYRLILEWVILPSCAIAIALAVFVPSALQVKDWKIDLLCGALALVFFLVLYFLPRLVLKVEALGFGDVELGLFIGLALATAALPAIIYGILLGGLIPGALLLFRLKKRHDYVPYGPFLCLGALAAMLMRAWA
jgi:leader peptidase (prepilin peptidase)/N-methyltransferase